MQDIVMYYLLWPGIVIAVASVIVWEKKRMRVEPHIRERRARDVQQHELLDDYEMDFVMAPQGVVQSAASLRELQCAIMDADDHRVRVLLNGMGSRHPDSMKLDRELTPLLLAAYMLVRSGEHDRRLKRIMRTLLLRGANITQREILSGVNIMHLLACQPRHCSVIHRIRFLLNTLDEYRNGGGDVPAMPGLNFDPILNGAPVTGGGGDMVSISVHLLGMRCYQGQLPEALAPVGDRRQLLQRTRRKLPPGLQDTGNGDNNADFN